MKKISRSTLLYKRVFPVFWFGFLAVRRDRFHARTNVWRAVDFWPVPCFMAVVGVVIMKKFVWDLMDEVQDGGDDLLVRRGGDEERIPLSNIMNVNITLHMNPQRINLRLVKPGRFGSEVSFSPVTRFGFNRFAKNAVAEDLIVRVLPGEDPARLTRLVTSSSPSSAASLAASRVGLARYGRARLGPAGPLAFAAIDVRNQRIFLARHSTATHAAGRCSAIADRPRPPALRRHARSHAAEPARSGIGSRPRRD